MNQESTTPSGPGARCVRHQVALASDGIQCGARRPSGVATPSRMTNDSLQTAANSPAPAARRSASAAAPRSKSCSSKPGPIPLPRTVRAWRACSSTPPYRYSTTATASGPTPTTSASMGAGPGRPPAAAATRRRSRAANIVELFTGKLQPVRHDGRPCGGRPAIREPASADAHRLGVPVGNVGANRARRARPASTASSRAATPRSRRRRRTRTPTASCSRRGSRRACDHGRLLRHPVDDTISDLRSENSLVRSACSATACAAACGQYQLATRTADSGWDGGLIQDPTSTSAQL